MKHSRSILLIIAWIICLIWLYISATNFASFLNFESLNLSKIGTYTLHGVLIVNLMASLFSLTGLCLSTFKRSLLQKRIEFRKLLIIGACMFPMASLIELAGNNFQLTRYFWVSFAVSICISLLISLAISTAGRNNKL
jgi:hypothetical protein